MYKPHYLNIEREKNTIYAGNVPYLTQTKVIYNGYKRPVSEKKTNKSGRRFLGNGK